MKSLRMLICCLLLGGLTLSPLVGCENLPGSRGTQGAVIGGAGGAVLGAVIAKQNRLLGALIGGALGAGGGYLIGAKTDWFGKDKDKNRSAAEDAVDKAQRDPATADEARHASTADVNNDGFVTLDEVVAMKNAGLSDSQMIKRLEATDQVFDLNSDQEKVLRDNGVSQRVIDRMRDINRDAKDRLLSRDTDVISRDR
jgi:hypothetical protein